MTKLEPWANISRIQSDEETYDMSVPDYTDLIARLRERHFSTGLAYVQEAADAIEALVLELEGTFDLTAWVEERERLIQERDALKADIDPLLASVTQLELERDALRDALRIEQQLALRTDPFKCDEIECCRFGHKVRAGDCHCYDMKAREHREIVRRLLGDPR